jgi:UDP-N-acetylmuramoyl-L-alanyl-D-glutamate--2,6-diaminopimelate ligase
MALTLKELLAELPGAQLLGAGDSEIRELVYDSRRVKPGDVFVAIKGQHSDGHDYIPQAIAAGAAAVVVDERYWHAVELDEQVPHLVVTNSRAALGPLAAVVAGRPGQQLQVVGITGTKGKSTSSELTAQVLEAAGGRSGMIGTVDFKIGERRWANDTRQSTPEAPEVQALLAEMVAAGCDYAVIEATSHALSASWDRLAGCDFDVAVFTNLGHEHLDYHGSFAQYRRDKMRLFEMLAAGRPAAGQMRWAIVNADDPNHEFFLHAAPANAHRLRYAIESQAEIRASELQSEPDGSSFRVDSDWGSCRVRLALPGRFNVSNALAALSAALSQGLLLEAACAALERVPAVRGRMERIDAGQPFGVIVDYAHNPDSFEQVLAMLRPLTAGRLIAVFGSAGERDREKRPIQGEIAARYCDLLVLTDEDPRGEDPDAILAEIAAGAGQRPCLRIADRAAAIRAAFREAQAGDLILLLGKGHEGSIIYADHSRPWNESVEARTALAEMGYHQSGSGRSSGESGDG